MGRPRKEDVAEEKKSKSDTFLKPGERMVTVKESTIEVKNETVPGINEGKKVKYA